MPNDEKFIEEGYEKLKEISRMTNLLMKMSEVILSCVEEAQHNKKTDDEEKCEQCECEEDLFLPPPWNAIDFPNKTEGWIEFQKYIRKHPYLLKELFDC